MSKQLTTEWGAECSTGIHHHRGTIKVGWVAPGYQGNKQHPHLHCRESLIACKWFCNTYQASEHPRGTLITPPHKWVQRYIILSNHTREERIMIFIGLRLCLLELATGVNNMPFNKHNYSCTCSSLPL